MSRGVVTTQDEALTILEAKAAHPGVSNRKLSAITLLDHEKIRRLLAKQVPVVSELSKFKRDEILAGWQWMYLDALARVQDDDDKISWGDRRNAAVVLGIASEKILLLNGHPTQLVGHLHEVRIDLPLLAQRLADVSRAVRGPLPVVVEAEREHQDPSDNGGGAG